MISVIYIWNFCVDHVARQQRNIVTAMYYLGLAGQRPALGLVCEIFELKVASSHADFFIFETFRRNCPALVVKSAILKLKNKNQ